MARPSPKPPNASWGAGLATPCVTSATTKGCGKAEYRFNEIDRYRAQPALNLFVEYRPTADLSLRLEGDNVVSEHFGRSVRIFSGPRDANPLSYADDRNLTSSPSVLVSMRKAL
jgi:hypothetical protein